MQGTGKTTAAGKLALYLKKRGLKVLLVATDVYRPGAGGSCVAAASAAGQPCPSAGPLVTWAPLPSPVGPTQGPRHVAHPHPPPHPTHPHPAAAIDQLVTLGSRIEVPVFELGTGVPPPEIARRGLERAKREEFDAVIVDTAGRLQIDDRLMDELKEVGCAAVEGWRGLCKGGA